MAIPPQLLGPTGPASILQGVAPRTWPIIDEDCKNAVMRVLDRGILSGGFGPESIAFEEEFAEFVGARHALMTHSGTSALVVALAAAGVGPGDEVLVPAYTFVATPLAVQACGARPVFVDIDLDTGGMSPNLARQWVNERTRAIMPVHVHGCPSDLEPLAELAETFGGKVVEDAAQAHGAIYRGKPVGALYAGGGFSLQSSKNLGCGEGGVYVTNHADQAEVANQVRNFGQDLRLSDAEHFDPSHPLDGWRALSSIRPGGMYRGNEMTAAIARVQLGKLPERTRLCQQNAERLSARLSKLPGVLTPATFEDRQSVHHKYRLRFDVRGAGLDEYSPEHVRAALLAAMKAAGFEVTLWERAPQPIQKVFREAESLPENLQENYRASFPVTSALLDSSIVLFTQSCPLIAQTAEYVDLYAKAFEVLWESRHSIVQSYDD